MMSLFALLLAGCLPVAPRPAEESARGIEPLEPVYAQGSLVVQGAPALRGWIHGTCDGEIVVEAVSANQARPLARVRVGIGNYVLFVPPDVAFELRWACDADKDGRVPAAEVAEASLGGLHSDVPLDLRVLPPEGARRLALSRPASTTPGPPTLLPPGAAAAVPTAGLAPPDGAAPADAAVGPPLPDGPPADAGPPPDGAAGPPL